MPDPRANGNKRADRPRRDGLFETATRKLAKEEKNMQYNQALNNYQKTAVETADILQLVIMCYDAAIRDLEDARKLHESNSIEATYEKLRHVQDIVTELLIGLDYERGGEISTNLSRLYNYILRQLIGINIKQDTKMYGHLIHILSELKDAWEQIRQNATTTPPAPTPGHGQRRWQASA